MSNRQTLPVLPLRGTVIFPGLTAPIAAGRPGTLRAIESALKGDRLVFAVAQRDNAEDPAPEILYSMGVIARIGQIQRGLGGVQLLLHGEQRASSLQYTTTDGFLSAVVMPVEEMSPLDDQRRGLRGAAQGDPRARRRARRAPRPPRGGRAPGARLRHRAGQVRRPRGRLHRALGRPRSRACSRRSRWRSACAGCWCTCSGRSRSSRRRRRSSRRCRRSSASGSARCSCASR